MKLLALIIGSLLLIAGIGVFWAFQDPGSGTSEEETSLASTYIRANISKLSPTPSVLGGTFYVTNITFPAKNIAVVNYEDGHIALTAEAHYTMEKGRVVIQSFVIKNTEEDPTTQALANDFAKKYNQPTSTFAITVTTSSPALPQINTISLQIWFRNASTHCMKII